MVTARLGISLFVVWIYPKFAVCLTVLGIVLKGLFEKVHIQCLVRSPKSEGKPALQLSNLSDFNCKDKPFKKDCRGAFKHWKFGSTASEDLGLIQDEKRKKDYKLKAKIKISLKQAYWKKEKQACRDLATGKRTGLPGVSKKAETKAILKLWSICCLTCSNSKWVSCS